MKKIFLAFALILVVTVGAFAQISLGVTAAQYSSEPIPLKDAWSTFTGDNQDAALFWGGFGEIAFGKLGFGLSFNAWDVDEDFWVYDVNFYAIQHLFGARAFLDPFIQIGFGINALDVKDPSMNTYDNQLTGGPNDPLGGAAYWDLGAGLGLNLGSLGIFFRGMYVFPFEGALVGEDWYGNEYEIFPIDLFGNFKWTFGAKIIL
jgi:hypothetical protein